MTKTIQITKYQIKNSVSSLVLGIFGADNETQALDTMAKEAGYKDYASLVARVPSEDGEIIVTDVTADIAFVVDYIVEALRKNRELNGNSYREWHDADDARAFFCDFDLLDEQSLSAEQFRVAALLYSNPDLCDAVDAVVDAWIKNAVEQEMADIGAAIKGADDLDGLRDALLAADTYVRRHDLGEWRIYDASDLPTYGGKSLTTAPGIYSWDQDKVLTFGSGGWNIQPRKVVVEHDGLDSQGYPESNGIAYRASERGHDL